MAVVPSVTVTCRARVVVLSAPFILSRHLPELGAGPPERLKGVPPVLGQTEDSGIVAGEPSNRVSLVMTTSQAEGSMLYWRVVSVMAVQAHSQPSPVLVVQAPGATLTSPPLATAELGQKLLIWPATSLAPAGDEDEIVRRTAPPPCCRVWANSCASIRRPDDEAGWYCPAAKTMSAPRV